MTVLFLTLGFQESFQLRSIFRHGKESLSEVVLISPVESNERVLAPMATIKNFCESINLKFSSKQVEVENIFRLIGQVSEIFYNHIDQDMIVNISGGMKILHLGIILSLINLKLNPLIELDFENQSGGVGERLRDLLFYDLKKETRDTLIAVNKSINPGASITNFIHDSKATIWRRLKRLEEQGYIKRNGKGTIIITKKGKLVLDILNLKF